MLDAFLSNHTAELILLGAFAAGVIVGLLQWALLELLALIYWRLWP